MFIAGVVPGLMLATMLGLTTWYRAWKNDYPRMPRATLGRAPAGLPRLASGACCSSSSCIGGIYTGMFTPTEAAAVSAVYAFVIAVFVYKDMSLKTCPACCSPPPT